MPRFRIWSKPRVSRRRQHREPVIGGRPPRRGSGRHCLLDGQRRDADPDPWPGLGVRPKGVRVNAVTPGLILGSAFHAQHTPEEMQRKIIAGIPLGRAARPKTSRVRSSTWPASSTVSSRARRSTSTAGSTWCNRLIGLIGFIGLAGWKAQFDTQTAGRRGAQRDGAAVEPTRFRTIASPRPSSGTGLIRTNAALKHSRAQRRSSPGPSSSIVTTTDWPSRPPRRPRVTGKPARVVEDVSENLVDVFPRPCTSSVGSTCTSIVS